MDTGNQLLKEQAKLQIKWGVDLFLFFISLLIKRGILQKEEYEKVRKNLNATSLSNDEYIEGLNQNIEMINAMMKGKLNNSRYAPFPKFSIATEPFLESAVLDQLDMLERTLSEAEKADLIGWKEESGFFSEILELFEKVEKKSIKPQEAMARSVKIMEKINKHLGKDKQIPLPNLNAYEF